jgi:hypothetical protein
LIGNGHIARYQRRSTPVTKASFSRSSPEQSKAFTELKEYIEKMATLSPPSSSEPLFLYVAASKAAVSAVLVREVEGDKR